MKQQQHIVYNDNPRSSMAGGDSGVLTPSFDEDKFMID
jgi:hypothetical protein